MPVLQSARCFHWFNHGATQDEAKAKWEAEKAAAAAKLRRDRLALEKQSRQLLQLPTKKDRSEVRTCP